MSSENEVSEGRETALYAGKVFMGLGILGVLCGIPLAWRFIQDFFPVNTRLFAILTLVGAILFAFGNLLRRLGRGTRAAAKKSSSIPFDEQLRRLESLRVEGLVSEDEYNDLRLKVMAQLG